MKIFLCGDVMLGRGIDQVLPAPCPPALYEPYMSSATGYCELAEQRSGPIPRPVDLTYIWGAATEELRRAAPDARIINLETAITLSEDHEPKGINYRMSPQNAATLTSLPVDCCVLANNHILDWGAAGLADTLARLDELGIKTAGAGRNLAEASAPAILETGSAGRLVVFSFATTTSGVPRPWGARPDRPGVNLLPDLSEATAGTIARQVEAIRRPQDILLVSLHCGPNWGYEIDDQERRFAHALIDEARISILHGHSSHHAKAIEVYKRRLILYGCGDFLNDYEGIRGYEEFRGDLALMYFPTIDPVSGDLASLELTPLQIRRFQLIRPSAADAGWLQRTLDRESRPFETRIKHSEEGWLAACWT